MSQRCSPPRCLWLPVLCLLLLAMAPGSASAHDVERRGTAVDAASCPAGVGPMAEGCRPFAVTVTPNGTPDVPEVCTGTWQGRDPHNPRAFQVVRVHVQAGSGEGVAGQVAVTFSSPNETATVHGAADEQGRADIAPPVLRPGDYTVSVSFGGSERAAVHGDPSHALRIIYEPSTGAGVLKVSDCDDLRVTFKPTLAQIKTGLVFDRSQGKASFWNSDGDCISGCTDVTLIVRDAAGEPVKGARVTLTADPIAGDLTHLGKTSRGHFCNAKIGKAGTGACSEALVRTTNAEGRIDGPLIYQPPTLLADTETVLKAKVDRGESVAIETRRMPLKANVVVPERTVQLDSADALALAPSASAYRYSPDVITFEQLSKSCDSVKPVLNFPLMAPIKRVCDGLGNAFNPFGIFDKFKWLHVGVFIYKLDAPAQGLFYPDPWINDYTSDYIDAIHDLFRNAFSVYGQDFVMGSSVTFKLTEVSYPNGRVAARFQAQFKAPNGHAMATVDTELKAGYDPTLFLSTVRGGMGAPMLRAGSVTAGASAASLELGCTDPRACRGTVTLRRSGAPAAASAASRGQVLGRASYRIGAGGRKTIRVKLTPAARALLRVKSAVAVDVELRAGGGITRRAVTLRRSGRARR